LWSLIVARRRVRLSIVANTSFNVEESALRCSEGMLLLPHGMPEGARMKKEVTTVREALFTFRVLRKYHAL